MCYLLTEPLLSGSGTASKLSGRRRRAAHPRDGAAAPLHPRGPELSEAAGQQPLAGGQRGAAGGSTVHHTVTVLQRSLPQCSIICAMSIKLQSQ